MIHSFYSCIQLVCLFIQFTHSTSVSIHSILSFSGLSRGYLVHQLLLASLLPLSHVGAFVARDGAGVGRRHSNRVGRRPPLSSFLSLPFFVSLSLLFSLADVIYGIAAECSLSVCVSIVDIYPYPILEWSLGAYHFRSLFPQSGPPNI